MIIFVVVGIGVDDVIVVVGCLDRQKVGLPISQRVSRALGEVGPAILLYVAPKPTQDPLPLWIGGSSKAAIRRTATLGTGWLAGLLAGLLAC